MRGLRGSAVVIGVLMAVAAFAFEPVPKESVKALRITRGKPFSKGVVFVNGKYIEPPYVVERRGTGLCINAIPITGEVVSWTEFIKTQEGVKVTKSETAPAAAPVEEQPEAAEPAAVDDDELDDLFDDEPESGSKPAVRRPVVVARPKVTVTYALEGEFAPNEASNALLSRINGLRTDIDRRLRAGGFLCFGDGYAQVSGDSRTLDGLLKALPELQQKSADITAFREGVRKANLVFVSEALAADLFRNRIDYVKLKALREKANDDQKWKKELEGIGQPLF